MDPAGSALTWLLLGHAYLGISNIKEAASAYMRYYTIQKKIPLVDWTQSEKSQFTDGMKKLADCLASEGRGDELARITAELDELRSAV